MVNVHHADSGLLEAGNVAMLDADSDGGRGADEDLPGDSGSSAGGDDSSSDVGGVETGGDAPSDPSVVDAWVVDVSRDVSSDPSLTDVGGDLPYDTSMVDAWALSMDSGGPGAGVAAPVLPSPRHEPAVFSDGESAYVAGGLDDKGTLLSQIVRFTPSSATMTVLPETLPTPSYAAGVAWTGTTAYLFGGIGPTGALRQIVRYVPASGATTVMSAQLPVAVYNVGTVWTGDAVYALGGQAAGVHLTQILKYDPATDTLSPLPTGLPVGIEAPAVFWDGNLVWVLGGKVDAAGSSGVATNVVQTFSPASGQAVQIGTIPYAVWDMPAFSDGKVFYVPGGSQTSTTGYTSILRFDPATQVASTLGFSLPVRAAGRVGTWVASVGAGYICGGADYATGKPSDKIVQVVP